MLKGKYVLLSLAAALVCWQVAGIDTANSGIVDPCKSTVTANAGVVLVCPLGDGDALSSNPGGGIANCPISLVVRDNANVGIAGIPGTDMWQVGCNDGLLLCGGSATGNADLPTDATGATTFSNEPAASGCDTGIYVVVQGIVIQDAGTCLPKCLPIAARSPDYKSAGGAGDPPACGADLPCPDYKVTNADFSWFSGHYTINVLFPKPYFTCADYGAPLGVIGLSDLSKFTVHFLVPGSPIGHHCVI